MIAVRPGKPAYDVLRLIVECPGEHTTGTLVDALDPAPRRTVPFTRDDPPARWAAMVAEHNRAAGAKMARLVGKLVEAATVAGWYGQKRLALDVQDGVVTLVRETDERTYHVGPRKKAA